MMIQNLREQKILTVASPEFADSNATRLHSHILRKRQIPDEQLSRYMYTYILPFDVQKSLAISVFNKM